MATKKEVRKAETISLDQLIQISSISAVRSFQDLGLDRRFNPRIWVGIWIEPFGSGELNIPGQPRG
jgi:hypothetical protein